MTKLTAEQLTAARAIANAADDGGTIQAEGMLALSRAGHIPTDPTLHTTSSVERAWQAAGIDAEAAAEALFR